MSTSNSIVLIGVVALLLSAPQAGLNAADFVLVDRMANVEAAPIIVSKDAPPFTREAAAVLADYVEKISGSRPKVIAGEPRELPDRAVWVGVQSAVKKLFPKTDFDFEHHEEILIKANENHLVITGRDRWHPDHLVVKGKRETVNGVQREYGTANAVYTFIHDHLDVRWLWPGELGEEFEKRDRIAFEPFEFRYHPPLTGAFQGSGVFRAAQTQCVWPVRRLGAATADSTGFAGCSSRPLFQNVVGAASRNAS